MGVSQSDPEESGTMVAKVEMSPNIDTDKIKSNQIKSNRHFYPSHFFRSSNAKISRKVNKCVVAQDGVQDHHSTTGKRLRWAQISDMSKQEKAGQGQNWVLWRVHVQFMRPR